MNTSTLLTIPRETPVSKKRAPPVAHEIKERAKKSLAHWVGIARVRFNNPLFMPTISFDLTGTTAGKAFLQSLHVQLNAVLLSENIASFESDTIPHELAHLIVFHLKGSRGGHGPEWKSAMQRLGVDPSRTHNYDVTNSRTTKVISGYTCGCGVLDVSPRLHERIRRGAQVTCRKCGQRPKYLGAPLSPPVPTFKPRPTPFSVVRTPPSPVKGTPAPVRAPSEAMLKFATSLARKHRIDLPAVVSTDYAACRLFLDKWSKVLPSAPVSAVPVPLPRPAYTPNHPPKPAADVEHMPTERQQAYAHSIAVRKKLIIPPEVLNSKVLISKWIDAHK